MYVNKPPLESMFIFQLIVWLSIVMGSFYRPCNYKSHAYKRVVLSRTTCRLYQRKQTHKKLDFSNSVSSNVNSNTSFANTNQRYCFRFVSKCVGYTRVFYVFGVNVIPEKGTNIFSTEVRLLHFWQILLLFYTVVFARKKIIYF